MRGEDVGGRMMDQASPYLLLQPCRQVDKLEFDAKTFV